MVATLILFGAVIAALLTGLIYYKGKYWNYKDISDASFKELLNKEAEYKSSIQDLYSELDKNKKNYKNKCNKEYKKKLQNVISEKNKEYNILINQEKAKLEEEYNAACEEVKTELFAQLEEIDKALSEHAIDLASKNILTFSCSCSRDLIPCPIDFSKENTFICPKCGSKYKVAISANPILIGRSISEEDFAELVEERLNDNRAKN